MTLRRRTWPRNAALVATALSALFVAPALLATPARADEQVDPLRWLGGQPLTLFDLGVMRLERDVLAAAPWLAESDSPGDRALSGVQYEAGNKRLVIYIALQRPRAERTEANCVALFRRLVERMTAQAPQGPGRAAWYLEKTFVPIGRERIGPDGFGERLSAQVYAEITLRGRSDDARAAETGRMTCRGRLDAADSEIERRFVN